MSQPVTNKPCPASNAMSASPMALAAVRALSASATVPSYSLTISTLPPAEP